MTIRPVRVRFDPDVPRPNLAGLPKPLVAAKADLRTSFYDPVERSAFKTAGPFVAEEPEVFRIWAALRAASMEEVPAGSLPYDLAMLVHMAGLGAVPVDVKPRKSTLTVQELIKAALEAYFLCRDGRLYCLQASERVSRIWGSRQQKVRAGKMGGRPKKLSSQIVPTSEIQSGALAPFERGDSRARHLLKQGKENKEKEMKIDSAQQREQAVASCGPYADVLEKLAGNRFGSFFKDVRIRDANDRLSIVAPSEMVANYIRSQYAQRLEDRLNKSVEVLVSA